MDPGPVGLSSRTSPFVPPKTLNLQCVQDLHACCEKLDLEAEMHRLTH